MSNQLQAELRTDTGKGFARRLRAEGRVPAVIYGYGVAPISVSIEGRELLHLIHANAGSNLMVDLTVDGKTHSAIARQIERDHLRNRYVHVDFQVVDTNRKITVTVEVTPIGDAAGVRAGGVIENHIREVEVECFPQDVPSGIEADISALELGDMLHVRDLVAPNGVTVMTNGDEAILSIITPAALRVEADLSVPGAEAAEGAAPAEAAAPAAEEGGES